MLCERDRFEKTKFNSAIWYIWRSRFKYQLRGNRTHSFWNDGIIKLETYCRFNPFTMNNKNGDLYSD